MKVTVWGINYAPELIGIGPYNTALCEYLHERGHDVRMVTTFTYYPAWRKQASEASKLYRTDNVEGVTVHRCWHYVPRRASTLKRIFHEGSFVFTSLLRQLVLPRADVLVVVSPPLLLGAAAWLLGKLKRMPFVFHVQDLQPDAAASLGMLKQSGLLGALRGLEKFAYRKAGLVSGIMPGMLASFERKGVEAARRCYFPNPVELSKPFEPTVRGRFRQRLGMDETDFLAVYSGNLGVKQGLDVLIEAARCVKHPRVRLVICGNGSQRVRLVRLVHRYELGNVVIVDLQPPDRYAELLVDADVCVIPQQPGSGGCFFPSKLLTTLTYARPVLTVADDQSDLVVALKEGRFGVNVPPGEPQQLAEVLEQLADQPQQLQKYGEAGHRYVTQFERTQVLGQFERVLQGLVEPATVRAQPEVAVPKIVRLPGTESAPAKKKAA